jgi:hypothetical protein
MIRKNAPIAKLKMWKSAVATAGRSRRKISPRTLLTRHLIGSGIEVGPGHHPFVVHIPGVHITYIDRWTPEEGGELFPQMGPFATELDLEADFNTDRLSPIPSGSQDFVIASHVLEHLAEPLGFLAEIFRVLRPGGTALLLLPDRHRTRDRHRAPTTVDHLVAEYDAAITRVSDLHLLEFLEDRGIPLPESEADRQRLLDVHRKRSIHVHCWDDLEFVELLLWGIDHLDTQWEFVDGCLPFDGAPPSDIEFGYVLRRSEVALDPAARRLRFTQAWAAWREAQAILLAPTTATEMLLRIYHRARNIGRSVTKRIVPHRG